MKETLQRQSNTRNNGRNVEKILIKKWNYAKLENMFIYNIHNVMCRMQYNKIDLFKYWSATSVWLRHE